MSAFAYSTSIFSLVTTSIVNPDNVPASLTETHGLTTSYYFSEEVARNTPRMLLWLAGIFSLLGVFGVLLISEKEGKPGQAATAAATVTACDLLSPTFLSLFVSALMSVALSMYVSSAYKIYGNERFRDDKYLTVVGAVSALLSGTSMVVWAELFEWAGFKPVYMLLVMAQILISATLDAAATTETVYMIYIILIFVSQGCHFALFPAVLSKMYGRTKGALLLSILYSGFGFSALACFLIQKYALQAIGYQTMYWILTGGAVVSVGLMINFEEVAEPQTEITEKLLPPQAL